VRVCLIEPGMFATGLLQRGDSSGKRDGCETKDDSLLDAYGPHEAMMQPIREFTEFFERVNGGPDGMEKYVGGAVVDAACSPSPPARKLVGMDANFLMRWLPYMPTYISDWEFATRHHNVLAAHNQRKISDNTAGREGA